MQRVIGRLRLRYVVLAVSTVVGASACATAGPPGALSADASSRRERGDDDGRDFGLRDGSGPGGSEQEVVVLRERVSRLERRLAETDAKLGLLLAQRQSGRGDAAVVRGNDPVLPRHERAEEGSIGARPMDLSTRPSIYDDVDPADERGDASSRDTHGRADGQDPPLVIRVDGRGAVVDDAIERPRRRSDGSPPPGGTGPQILLGSTIEEVYQFGQSRLKAGATLEALSAFEDVTEHAADHDLADNALYWTGFVHAKRGDHRLALDVWQRLPVRFPKSSKIADALFGMAQSHESVGEPALAETLYLEIVSQYPKAEKAKEAQKALRRLRPR
jgi:TolA-binding protein